MDGTEYLGQWINDKKWGMGKEIKDSVIIREGFWYDNVFIY